MSNVPVYMRQGGAEQVIDRARGGKVVDLGTPQQFTFAAAAGGTNVCEVTVTAKTAFRVAAQGPDGRVSVSAALITANYG